VELWWYFTPLYFTPILFLASGLVAAPLLCQPPYGTSYLHGYCKHTALSYMTLEHRALRKTVTTGIFIMLLQLLQALLHQFPQWRSTLQHTPIAVRYVVQWTLCFLTSATLLYTTSLIVKLLGIPAQAVPGKLQIIFELTEIVWCLPALIILWIVWLQAFVLLLIQRGREHWRAVVNVHNAQRMFRHMRFCLFVLLLVLFFVGCLNPFVGFPEAQLQLTICTIIIPAFYVVLYVFADTMVRLTRPLVVAGCVVSLVVASVICSFTDLGGPGSFSMVFLHVFGKFVQFFGSDSDNHDDFESGSEKAESSANVGQTVAQELHAVSAPVLSRTNDDVDSDAMAKIPSTGQAHTQEQSPFVEPPTSKDTPPLNKQKLSLVRAFTQRPREIVEHSLTHLQTAKDIVLNGLAQSAEYSPLVRRAYECS
jgi:hypothetical protein